MPRSTDILLVQPPVQHPALFAPAVLLAAAALRKEGREPVLFHAGADFAVNYLMAAPVRAQLMQRVQERLQDGAFIGIDDDTLQKTQRYAECRDPLDALLVNAAPDALQKVMEAVTFASCRDPLKLAQSMRCLDEALHLVSVAHFPAYLDRRGFSHPELDDESALEAWLGVPGKNPFLEYARHWCRPTVDIEQCEAVVLIVATSGQMAGALTLARCWKKRHPSLKLAICAIEERLQRVAKRQLGGVAQTADWEIARIVQRAIKASDNTPQIFSTIISDEPTDSQQQLLPQIHSSLLQPEKLQDLPALWEDGDGSVIVWHHPQGELASISRLLFSAAKQGVWNHIVLSDQDDPTLVAQLRQLADENPYIVHSWCRREMPISAHSDAMERYPEASPSYGETAPLTGRSLWQRLQDPVFLQACVAKHGAKMVAQQRLRDNGSGLVTLGNHLVYNYSSPEQLPPGYFDEICLMVEAGGTVGSRWLRYNLERAFLIGYAEENGVIAGNSSLKRPREEYVNAVSEQCGIDLRHYLERGYTSVRPEYRSMGVGAKLLKGLTDRAEGYRVYSVIAEDNVATQKMAIRNRTRLVASYFSQRTRKQIGIWIPEWMLPKGVQLPRQPDMS